MARQPRVDVGGEIYHVINRSNGRFKIFENEAMYQEFEALLRDMKERYDMRILAYVLMPNHWHLLLHPKKDGDLGRAMQWLGTTHTRRFHTKTNTVGGGHLYQGRYKSFLIENDNHLLTVLKYIERNALRARMVTLAEYWKWGSVYQRLNGTETKLLTDSPVPLPRNYPVWINQPEPAESLKAVRLSVVKGVPFGGETWRNSMIKRYSLAQTLRSPGRPKNGD